MCGHLDIWEVYPNIWWHPNIYSLYMCQNNPINFMEIKFSSQIHVDTVKMEHSQSGSVCSYPNNILRYAAATLTI